MEKQKTSISLIKFTPKFRDRLLILFGGITVFRMEQETGHWEGIKFIPTYHEDARIVSFTDVHIETMLPDWVIKIRKIFAKKTVTDHKI